MQANWGAMKLWQRLGLRGGVMLLAAAIAGLPINDLFKYTLLLAVVVTAFAGSISVAWKRWLSAFVLGALVIASLCLFPAPRIDEGFNVFVPPNPSGAPASLPDDVLQGLTAQFNAQYPPEKRCDDPARGCWRPDRNDTMNGFAFSADGIYGAPEFSRRVTGIHFSDPVWLRVGAINELSYNWPDDQSDIRRFDRDRRSLNIFDRFRVTFPLVVTYRFPSAFAGSELCWHGVVFWEKPPGGYDAIKNDGFACRQLGAQDIGRKIYAASILRDAPLAMTLRPAWTVQLRKTVEIALTLIGVIGIGILLIKVERRRLWLPVTLIVITTLVTSFIDLHFIGGFRPLDGGDDGYTYEGFARYMLRDLLAGNIVEVLRGHEDVYFFTPGFRYFRLLERLIFGDTFLGYFSAVLLLPFLVLALARRFLPAAWSLAFVLLFAATPFGVVFGSTLADYITIASRGYADTFAYVLLLAGLLAIIPQRGAKSPNIAGAFSGACLLAMATFCRPNIVLVAGPFLFCAAVMQLQQRRVVWVMALFAGYATLAVSPLHNYVFGISLVPFSNNAITRETMRMLPSEYLRAALDIITLNLGSPYIPQAFTQAGHWLGGTHDMLWTIPFNALGFVVLIRVGVFGRLFDPWLRALALATLFLHGIGICYVSYTRYNLATWLLTGLVSAVWWHREGLTLLIRWQPAFCARATQSKSWALAARGFRRLQTSLNLADEQSTSGTLPR